MGIKFSKFTERPIGQTLGLGFALSLGVTLIICISVVWFSALINKAKSNTELAQKKTLAAIEETQRTERWLIAINQTEADLNRAISQLYQKQLRNEKDVTEFTSESDPIQTLLDSGIITKLSEQYPERESFFNQIRTRHQTILNIQQNLSNTWRQSHEGLADLLREARRTTIYWTLKVANMIFVQSSIDELLYESAEDAPILAITQSPVFQNNVRSMPKLSEMMDKVTPLNKELWQAANDLDFHIMMYEWDQARKLYRDKFPPITKSMGVYLDDVIAEEEVILGAQAEASLLLDREMVPAVEAVIKDIGDLKFFLDTVLVNQKSVVEKQTEEMEASWARVETAINWIKWIIILLTVISGVFSFIFIRWISEQLVKPIKTLACRAKAISEGDLRTQSIPNGRRDEIGVLVSSVNEMSDSLHHVVSQFYLTMRDVAINAEQISTASQQTAGGMNEQTSYVFDIHDKIEQITTLANEIEVQMEEVNQRSKHAEGTARKGINVVNTALTKMTSIQGVFREMSKSILDLKQSIDGIGEITKLIEGIALKSRLLAVNAAIEAARAGKYGRGFSVIVEEIQSLANQTLSATKQVDEYVTELELKTKQTVSRSDGGMTALSEGVELSKTAQESLAGIVEGSEQVSTMIQSANQAVITQTDRTREVANLVEGIAVISQQSNESARQTVGIGVRLNEKSSDINSMLRNFRLN